MDKPNVVHVSFVASTPQQVWDLMMDADASPDWYSDNRMEVGAAAGDDFRVLRPDGSIDVDGKILAFEPPARLRVSWIMPDLPQSPRDDEVEFLIEDKGNGVVRLAVQEFHGDGPPAQWIEAGREGWSLILSSLKTLLETGKPLPKVKMEPPE
jgi:uncharacterized protein YndB with AHSA1/START domain